MRLQPCQSPVYAFTRHPQKIKKINMQVKNDERSGLDNFLCDQTVYKKDIKDPI